MAKKAPAKKRTKKIETTVAPPSSLHLPVPAVPSAVATLGNMEALAGCGLEDVSADDYAIPFVRILQPLSPQVVQETVEDAEAGDIIETATNSLYSEINVIPCAFKRHYIEWKPRELGGGFVQSYEIGDPVIQTAVRKGNKDILPNDNELQNTSEFYCLLDSDGMWMPVVISMTATQLKRGRRWLTMMQKQKMTSADGKRTFTPPTFAYSYTLKTLSESNNAGTWWSWDIGKAQAVSGEELFKQAQNFSLSVKGGEVKTQDESGTEDYKDSKAGFSPETGDKDIPF
ncbi:MAG: hypothetical protein V3S55_07815 [Nitrospiraceae bacterium]